MAVGWIYDAGATRYDESNGTQLTGYSPEVVFCAIIERLLNLGRLELEELLSNRRQQWE